jgi:hypothetical protein
MRRVAVLLGSIALLGGCKYGSSSFPFSDAYRGAYVLPDARLEGVGQPVPPPDDATLVDVFGTPRGLLQPENLRFAPTSPEHVELRVGRDTLDDSVVLGSVNVAYSDGIGAHPDRLALQLKRAASLLGADAVLDVTACGPGRGSCLSGLAVRNRDHGGP